MLWCSPKKTKKKKKERERERKEKKEKKELANPRGWSWESMLAFPRVGPEGQGYYVP